MLGDNFAMMKIMIHNVNQSCINTVNYELIKRDGDMIVDGELNPRYVKMYINIDESELVIDCFDGKVYLAHRDAKEGEEFESKITLDRKIFLEHPELKDNGGYKSLKEYKKQLDSFSEVDTSYIDTFSHLRDIIEHGRLIGTYNDSMLFAKDDSVEYISSSEFMLMANIIMNNLHCKKLDYAKNSFKFKMETVILSAENCKKAFNIIDSHDNRMLYQKPLRRFLRKINYAKEE